MTMLTLFNLPRFLNILSQSIALMTPCCQTFESLLTSSRFVSIHSPLLGFPDLLIDSVLKFRQIQQALGEMKLYPH